MNGHLSDRGVSMHVLGEASPAERRHAVECAACRARIANFTATLSNFRGAVREWGEQSILKDRAAEMRWTVIPATDPLERLLLPSIEESWYRSLWGNLRDFVRPERPLLDITSKPVLVRDIWGQYQRQKRSWVMSVALQSAAVLLLFTVASSKVAQQTAKSVVSLVLPTDIADFRPKAAKATGGGGGGDHSPLPASRGKAPKFAPRQFTPPEQVIANANPRLTMEPTLIGNPSIQLPPINSDQWGDPLAKLGPPSNGPGSGGGIGSGHGGGIGSGDGGGFGPGSGGGVGGGAFKVGGGVSAPQLISKVEPEYSEEARKARYEGTVLLYIEVDPGGRAQNIRVVRSLGLGLDEKAIEAVKKWKFKPGYKNGQPVTVIATVQVVFRLL
jgi:periplasmic protein TonB